MQPAYARGKLYWMVDPDICIELSGGRCEVLALDVSTKEFQVLQGPRCNYERVTSIVELLGNICVVCSDNRANAIDIWTLEEGADWFLGHRIELGDECLSDEATPLALDLRGDWIFLNTGKELGYYYPRTRTLTTICPIGQRLYGLETNQAPTLEQTSQSAAGPVGGMLPYPPCHAVMMSAPASAPPPFIIHCIVHGRQPLQLQLQGHSAQPPRSNITIRGKGRRRL
ncbi:hypothetical protein ZWY2020_034898 [Hordeum vulgare]|nr:hypothetical protein ZWY2020_034898 [Hordeum vulgare]